MLGIYQTMQRFLRFSGILFNEFVKAVFDRNVLSLELLELLDEGLWLFHIHIKNVFV